jgi:hypothetical protein
MRSVIRKALRAAEAVYGIRAADNPLPDNTAAVMSSVFGMPAGTEAPEPNRNASRINSLYTRLPKSWEPLL